MLVLNQILIHLLTITELDYIVIKTLDQTSSFVYLSEVNFAYHQLASYNTKVLPHFLKCKPIGLLLVK